MARFDYDIGIIGAGTYFSPKIFSERIQKGLNFFFHLKGRACALES